MYFADPKSPWQRGSNENTYWCTVMEPDGFDGSHPVSCLVTRKIRAVNGLPLICPRRLEARALTGVT